MSGLPWGVPGPGQRPGFLRGLGSLPDSLEAAASGSRVQGQQGPGGDLPQSLIQTLSVRL